MKPLRPLLLVILGVAAFIAFLVATVPARWLEARLAAAAPGKYEAHSVTGTLWHGEGQGVVNVPGGTLVIDHLEWRLLPSQLAQGRLAYTFDAKGAGFEAHYQAARTPGGWSLRDVSVSADAALATAMMPLLGRWKPEGRVSLTAPSIDMAGADVRGDATIEWQGAATTLSEVRPLGAYRATLSADGPGANLAVTTLDGPLRVSGNGRIEWPMRLDFMGEARGEGPKAASLASLLDLFGPARPDGSRTIDVRWK